MTRRPRYLTDSQSLARLLWFCAAVIVFAVVLGVWAVFWVVSA